MTTIFGLVFVTLGFIISLDWIAEREALMTEHVPTILAQEALEHHRAQVVTSMGLSIADDGTGALRGPEEGPLRSIHMRHSGSDYYVYTFVVHPKPGESAVPIAAEMHRLSGGHAGVGTLQAPDGITNRKRIVVSSRQTENPVDISDDGRDIAVAIVDPRFQNPAGNFLASNIGAIVTRYNGNVCNASKPLKTLFPLDPDDPTPSPECGEPPDSDS